jgi:undecaprenyl phosphate-alpha-L-ara4N flippase subunit ArnE
LSKADDLAEPAKSVEPNESVDPGHPAVRIGSRKLSLASAALLIFAVALAATGQVLLKHGMDGARLKAERGGGSLAVAAATSPWVLVGLMIFGISALAWMTTLSRVPLSIAYPFNALGYLGILTASVVILNERANVWTWVGTALVVGGLIIVVATKPG